MTGTCTNAQGVVLCNQPKVLDLKALRSAFCEKAPSHLVDEVLARIAPLFE
jgi:mRNA interferase ChpB